MSGNNVTSLSTARRNPPTPCNSAASYAGYINTSYLSSTPTIPIPIYSEAPVDLSFFGRSNYKTKNNNKISPSSAAGGRVQFRNTGSAELECRYP